MMRGGAGNQPVFEFFEGMPHYVVVSRSLHSEQDPAYFRPSSHSGLSVGPHPLPVPDPLAVSR
jgi:hypothetical protein